MVDNIKFKSFSEKGTEENNDERASRTAPSLLTRTSTASLFLTRLKNKRFSSKQDSYELESGRTQCNSPLSLDSPITPASHMDYSFISERPYSEEINRTCLRINEDFIGNVLTEHKKRICCKSQFWENLELTATNDMLTETVLPAPKSNEINVLDASLTLNRQGFAGELELQLDFHPLLQHRRNRHSRLPEIGYLNAFVKEGYKEILEHPLCQSFLHLKWHKIRKYYAARLLFYLIYVLIFTSWVITALAHDCYNASTVNCTNINENFTNIQNKTCTNCSYTFPKQTELLESMWYVLAILSILEAFRKVSVIPSYQSVRQFLQIENLVEWFVIVSVFATSFLYKKETFEWQNYLGAFAVLCGWSNLMLMIGQLPVFGAYVAMFTSVQAQVFKLLLAYACLLVGFTASFCVIFPRTQSFKSPHIGLTKVLVMMTGELNFEDFFFGSTKRYDKFEESFGLGQITVQLLFVLFLLFVTIVLMNLLIGIAVHDIKGLQKTAGLAKLVRQTKLIHDVEVAIFLGFTPSKRFVKFFRWTTLLLPSPLRAVLTVRPLNPREKRLPRDVLSASYKIAKEGDGQNNFSAIRKKSYFAKAYFKSDMNACRRRGIDEDMLIQDCNKFKDDIAELREICEKNHTLLRELVKMKGINK
ncbi:Transient receptor potential channel pyrexia [Camponotus floridanus]|uniref:Transient receptor potential channel pyrexia n=1 Tax=Camponotus floridanus TaxID=104421 RepID=E2ATS7_CAMFO|nr:Transient receptor potential channel pyrexia [Camponotus floridanus]